MNTAPVRRAAAILALFSGAAFGASWARADQPRSSVQPYIDQLKQDLPPSRGAGDIEAEGPLVDPYIQSVRRKLKEKGEDLPGSESHIERLKRMNPEVYEKSGAPAEETYITRGKQRLKEEEHAEPESAIQRFKDGRSELEPRKRGNIHHAAGLKFGASLTRGFKGGGAESFESVYTDNSAPDLTVFYEWQPFHSEWLGNVGFVLSGGVGYHRGNGAFSVALTNPVTGKSFGATSQTEFRFLTLPLAVGANYRFNLFRILRPYVQAQGAILGYVETRNDGGEDVRGNSKGLILSGGASILLDFLSPKDAWELYDDFSVKHYYLTFDLSRTTTIAGDVKLDQSALNVGLTYEF